MASNRARAHESADPEKGPRGGQKFEEARQDAAQRRLAGQSRPGDIGGSSQTGSTQPPTEAEPLVPMGDPNRDSQEIIDKIRSSMWYI